MTSSDISFFNRQFPIKKDITIITPKEDIINGPKLNQDLLEKKYFTMTNYYNRHINYPGINNSYSIDFSPKKYDMKYCLCE